MPQTETLPGFNDLLKKIMDLTDDDKMRLHATLGAMLGLQSTQTAAQPVQPESPVQASNMVSSGYQDPEEAIENLREAILHIQKTQTPYAQIQWIDKAAQEVALVECIDILDDRRKSILAEYPAVAVRVSVAAFATQAPGMFALGAMGLLLALGSFGYFLFKQIF